MSIETTPAELAKFAAELATGAGDILRAFAQHARTIETKSSNTDMVTDADTASERFLVDAIRNRRPDDGIIGEEGTNDATTSGVQWIVDPLDGTTNFVYSIPFYAVSVGALQNGIPIAGAVYNPALDELYSASFGNGAYLNGRPLRVNPILTLEHALVATGFSYSSETRARQGAIAHALLPLVRDIRRCGAAALDMCHVASGRVDAYYEHSVKPWDVTAGTIIASEAGARVTALDGGVPKNNVIAAPQPLYDLLLAHLIS